MGGRGGGRKREHEWSEFNDIEGDEGKTLVECSHCGEKVSKRIQRIKNHLEKCRVKNKQDKAVEDINENNIPIPPPPKRSRVMDSFVTKTSLNDKIKLDLQAAKFFYSCNISFHSAENKEYKKFCEMLRPGYKPPNERDLAGDLLDQVYDEVENKQVENAMKSESVTICQDGWESVTHDPILAHSYHDGEKNYLLDIKDCGSNKKDGEFCCNEVVKVIQEFKEKTGKEVFAVCTDNEPKMLRMRRLLLETGLVCLCYGCQAHYMNLLGNDVSDQNLLGKILTVQKHFRNVHRAHGLLKEKGGKVPVIPCQTRWNGKIDTLESYIENHSLYLEIRDEDSEIPNDVAKVIDNLSLKRKAQQTLDDMKKIAVALDKLQSDSCSLSDAFDIWNSLLIDPELASYKRAIKKRYDEAVEPFFILANLTDHRFIENNKVDASQEKVAEDWLQNFESSFFSSYVQFRLKDENNYPQYLFNDNMKSMTAKKWWKFVKMKAEKQGDSDQTQFADFMTRLHSCPSSSASLERWFSSLGFVWSKTRNRLGHVKAMKLVKCFRALRENV